MTGPTCPTCQTPNARTIGYGFPLEQPPEDVVTGRCVVRGDGTDPTHECRGAGRHRWRHSP